MEAEIAPAEARKLARASEERDLAKLHELMESRAHTKSGLPVAVLAGWQVFEITGEREDAEHLAALAIRERPSVISARMVEKLSEHFPDDQTWTYAWSRSEQQRGIRRAYPEGGGVALFEGLPVFVSEGVLTAEDTRDVFHALWRDHAAPEWLSIDYRIHGRSVLGRTGQAGKPLARAGNDLQIVAEVRSPKVLYHRYWKTVWWVAALILSAFLTALAGILFARRTLARERRLHLLKSHFVASVSHELRAPVASMRLMADALDVGKIKGEKAREFHRLMSQEGARLSALIENVLEFARIEEGKKDYSFRETDLRDLVRDTVKLMEPVAAEREVTIAVEIEQAGCGAVLDAASIQQAIINLLDNAIKYSPVGGRVELVLASAEGEWNLSISDQGPGIAREDRARVFGRFIRLENELVRETQGAGIGLSIVAHTVEAHEGTIEIEAAKGGGTKFIVRCPNSLAECADLQQTVTLAKNELKPGRATS